MTEKRAPYKTMATDGLHIASDYGLLTRRLREELQVLRAFRDAALPALLDARWLAGRMALLGLDTAQVYAAGQHIDAAQALIDASELIA